MVDENIEELAKLLHESGREAVEKRLIYRDDLPVSPFCEWSDLPGAAQEGRRSMARYLVANYGRVEQLMEDARDFAEFGRDEG